MIAVKGNNHYQVQVSTESAQNLRPFHMVSKEHFAHFLKVASTLSDLFHFTDGAYRPGHLAAGLALHPISECFN